MRAAEIPATEDSSLLVHILLLVCKEWTVQVEGVYSSNLHFTDEKVRVRGVERVDQSPINEGAAGRAASHRRLRIAEVKPSHLHPEDGRLAPDGWMPATASGVLLLIRITSGSSQPAGLDGPPPGFPADVAQG